MAAILGCIDERRSCAENGEDASPHFPPGVAARYFDSRARNTASYAGYFFKSAEVWRLQPKLAAIETYHITRNTTLLPHLTRTTRPLFYHLGD